MCELLGINSVNKMDANDLLKEFFSHSVHHPSGWGLATYHDDVASIEKEPLRAIDSQYLAHRLRHRICTDTLIAHVRLATVGELTYENCHPFVKKDSFGRRWTLAHNGTMFDCPPLASYYDKQEGQTDSERILYFLIDQFDQAQQALGRGMTMDERFNLLDSLVCQLAPGNKMNLIIYDGELMYLHTNYAHSLHVAQLPGTAIFSTRPLGAYQWEELPFTTLCAYHNGEPYRRGTNHHWEYFPKEEHKKFSYLGIIG